MYRDETAMIRLEFERRAGVTVAEGKTWPCQLCNDALEEGEWAYTWTRYVRRGSPQPRMVQVCRCCDAALSR